MSDLVKQLEDKKKGCKDKFTSIYLKCGWVEVKCGDHIIDEWANINEICYCPKCKPIIAILEQAIAEIEKQRQKILEEIDKFLTSEFIFDNNWEKKYREAIRVLINLKEQLNQPKEER